MIVERQDNSGLYFIVGALVVAVAAFAIFYFAGTNPDADRVAGGDTTIIERINPAAGDEQQGESNSMSLSVGEDGVSATQTTSESQ